MGTTVTDARDGTPARGLDELQEIQDEMYDRVHDGSWCREHFERLLARAHLVTAGAAHRYTWLFTYADAGWLDLAPGGAAMSHPSDEQAGRVRALIDDADALIAQGRWSEGEFRRLFEAALAGAPTSTPALSPLLRRAKHEWLGDLAALVTKSLSARDRRRPTRRGASTSRRRTSRP